MTADIPATFHNFFRGDELCKIDYIFASPQLHVQAAGRWTDEERGVYLSDHYPVWAELTL